MGDRVAGTRDSRRKNGEGEEREREETSFSNGFWGGEERYEERKCQRGLSLSLS